MKMQRPTPTLESRRAREAEKVIDQHLVLVKVYLSGFVLFETGYRFNINSYHVIILGSLIALYAIVLTVRVTRKRRVIGRADARFYPTAFIKEDKFTSLNMKPTVEKATRTDPPSVSTGDEIDPARNGCTISPLPRVSSKPMTEYHEDSRATAEQRLILYTPPTFIHPRIFTRLSDASVRNATQSASKHSFKLSIVPDTTTYHEDTLVTAAHRLILYTCPTLIYSRDFTRRLDASVGDVTRSASKHSFKPPIVPDTTICAPQPSFKPDPANALIKFSTKGTICPNKSISLISVTQPVAPIATSSPPQTSSELATTFSLITASSKDSVDSNISLNIKPFEQSVVLDAPSSPAQTSSKSQSVFQASSNDSAVSNNSISIKPLEQSVVLPTSNLAPDTSSLSEVAVSPTQTSSKGDVCSSHTIGPVTPTENVPADATVAAVKLQGSLSVSNLSTVTANSSRSQSGHLPAAQLESPFSEYQKCNDESDGRECPHAPEICYVMPRLSLRQRLRLKCPYMEHMKKVKAKQARQFALACKLCLGSTEMTQKRKSSANANCVQDQPKPVAPSHNIRDIPSITFQCSASDRHKLIRRAIISSYKMSKSKAEKLTAPTLRHSAPLRKRPSATLRISGSAEMFKNLSLCLWTSLDFLLVFQKPEVVLPVCISNLYLSQAKLLLPHLTSGFIMDQASIYRSCILINRPFDKPRASMQSSTVVSLVSIFLRAISTSIYKQRLCELEIKAELQIIIDENSSSLSPTEASETVLGNSPAITECKLAQDDMYLEPDSTKMVEVVAHNAVYASCDQPCDQLPFLASDEQPTLPRSSLMKACDTFTCIISGPGRVTYVESVCNLAALSPVEITTPELPCEAGDTTVSGSTVFCCDEPPESVTSPLEITERLFSIEVKEATSDVLSFDTLSTQLAQPTVISALNDSGTPVDIASPEPAAIQSTGGDVNYASVCPWTFGNALDHSSPMEMSDFITNPWNSSQTAKRVQSESTVVWTTPSVGTDFGCRPISLPQISDPWSVYCADSVSGTVVPTALEIHVDSQEVCSTPLQFVPPVLDCDEATEAAVINEQLDVVANETCSTTPDQLAPAILDRDEIVETLVLIEQLDVVTIETCSSIPRQLLPTILECDDIMEAPAINDQLDVVANEVCSTTAQPLLPNIIDCDEIMEALAINKQINVVTSEVCSSPRRLSSPLLDSDVTMVWPVVNEQVDVLADILCDLPLTFEDLGMNIDLTEEVVALTRTYNDSITGQQLADDRMFDIIKAPVSDVSHVTNCRDWEMQPAQNCSVGFVDTMTATHFQTDIVTEMDQSTYPTGSFDSANWYAQFNLQDPSIASTHCNMEISEIAGPQPPTHSGNDVARKMVQSPLPICSFDSVDWFDQYNLQDPSLTPFVEASVPDVMEVSCAPTTLIRPEGSGPCTATTPRDLVNATSYVDIARGSFSIADETDKVHAAADLRRGSGLDLLATAASIRAPSVPKPDQPVNNDSNFVAQRVDAKSVCKPTSESIPAPKLKKKPPPCLFIPKKKTLGPPCNKRVAQLKASATTATTKCKVIYLPFESLPTAKAEVATQSQPDDRQSSGEATMIDAVPLAQPTVPEPLGVEQEEMERETSNSSEPLKRPAHPSLPNSPDVDEMERVPSEPRMMKGLPKRKARGTTISDPPLTSTSRVCEPNETIAPAPP